MCVSFHFKHVHQTRDRNETTSTLQFADRVKKAVFEKPVSNNEGKKKYIDIEEYEKVQD